MGQIERQENACIVGPEAMKSDQAAKDQLQKDSDSRSARDSVPPVKFGPSFLFFPQQLKVRGGPEVRFHEGSTRVPPKFHEGSTRFCEGCGVVRALKRAPHAVGDVT